LIHGECTPNLVGRKYKIPSGKIQTIPYLPHWLPLVKLKKEMMKVMTWAMILVGNSAFQEILKNFFRSRFPSVDLLVAADGMRAMEKIESLLPDLILIDIKLPGNNALELTRKIKTGHPEIVVILVSSYDLPEYREAAYRQGADYFMTKDSRIEDYFALIESILSGRARPMKNAS